MYVKYIAYKKSYLTSSNLYIMGAPDNISLKYVGHFKQ
jgi:hypothetical protein